MGQSTSRLDKAEKMYRLLREQSESGILVKDFILQHGLSVATWYYWQRKFHKQNPAGNIFVNNFSLLEPQQEVADNGVLYAEFKGIRFYQEPSASLLKSLIG